MTTTTTTTTTTMNALLNNNHHQNKKNMILHNSTRSIRSNGTATSTSTTKSSGHLVSSSVHDNMIQKHKAVDPMEYYMIETVLGEGSMVCVVV